jgi:hypothetical protein
VLGHQPKIADIPDFLVRPTVFITPPLWHVVVNSNEERVVVIKDGEI